MFILRVTFYLLGNLLLGMVLYLLRKRDQQEALKNVSYISPLNGMIEHIPPSLRAQRYFLWAAMTGGIAATRIAARDYLSSIVYFVHIVIALYCAWVYRRGREPRIMEGYREFPDPPSLLDPK